MPMVKWQTKKFDLLMLPVNSEHSSLPRIGGLAVLQVPCHVSFSESLFLSALDV